MKNWILSFTALVVLACASARAADAVAAVPVGIPVETVSAGPNDNARFLAGMALPESSPLTRFTRDAAWKEHAKYFDAAWAKLEKSQLAKIRAWTAENLKAPKATCFYMFSGPDFLYADAFFPSASTYVMSGLEPVGGIPDVTKLASIGPAVRNLQRSLNSVLSFSFFITKDMRAELKGAQLDGTLPIFYVFLARSGKTIHEVSLIGLDKGGNEIAGGGKGITPGAKIVFSSGGGARQTLYYFSGDISNGGSALNGLLKFCEKLGTGDSLLKSASYLMHSDGFSNIRRFVLDHSSTIVQDDSGIPVSSFDDKWSLKPFGKYLGPIPLFKNSYQPKLKDLYEKVHPVPIDFGIGYRWNSSQSNLLVATRVK